MTNWTTRLLKRIADKLAPAPPPPAEPMPTVRPLVDVLRERRDPYKPTRRGEGEK